MPFFLAGIAIGYFSLGLFAPKTVMLKDGVKVTLAGVTYGKHHVYPGKTARPFKIDTTNDLMCVWIRQTHPKNSWPNFQLLTYDADETACVGGWVSRWQPSGQPNEEIGCIQLNAFPRRGRKIKLQVSEWNYSSTPVKPNPKWTVSNPARGSFPSWSAQPLPITQTDDDLTVTLTRLVYGEKFGGFQNQKKNDATTRGVLAAFRMEQGGHAVTNWQPLKFTTSDATGNSIVNTGWSNRRDKDETVMVYQWGLWPDEPAWKLKVEFSRTSGFAESECWTAKDLPIETGDPRYRYQREPKAAAAAESAIGAIHLKIYPLKKYENNNGQNQREAELQIHAEEPSDGFRMNLIKVTDDQNKDVKFYNRGWNTGDYSFGLRDVGEAKSVTVTVALHRSRFAEFTAKPAMK